MQIEKSVSSNSQNSKYQEISVIRLICQDGFFVSFLTAGASICQIGFSSYTDHLQNLALSFLGKETYLSNPLYAGATLAPAAGRISYGQLPVGSNVFSLSRNENDVHCLHGGFENASFRNWDLLLATVTESGEAKVSFVCTLADGLDGFPGNRRITVTYTLTEDHALTVFYEAVSDQDTYFNISNHSYFNLSGDFSHSALDHILQIHADRYIRNAPDFIPEGIADVCGTPFDFRQPMAPSIQYQKYPDDLQLARNQGYNHGFILNHAADHNRPDLLCISPDGSVQMAVFSDAPCMVFYSGGYIDNSFSLITGQTSVPSCALAFEFQDYPDAPGGHGFPYRITPAGTVWTRRICYHFSFR